MSHMTLPPIPNLGVNKVIRNGTSNNTFILNKQYERVEISM